MTSPISNLSRDYIRSRATNTMEYQCTIERVTGKSFDETTLKVTSGSREVIYEGVCRIWEITSSSSVAVGGADIDMQGTQLSTPWDSPLAKKNDEVVITDAPAWDEEMTGKRFQIQSSAKAGELRATHRYTVSSVE